MSGKFKMARRTVSKSRKTRKASKMKINRKVMMINKKRSTDLTCAKQRKIRKN